MYSKKLQEEYRKKNLSKYAEYQRRYRRRHKEKVKAYTKEWRKKNPQKVALWRKNSFKKRYIPHPRPRLKFLTSEEQTLKRKARVAAQTALKQGKLVRKPCSTCGNVKSQMHHPDYSLPLQVVWLCRSHHLEIHRNG